MTVAAERDETAEEAMRRLRAATQRAIAAWRDLDTVARIMIEKGSEVLAAAAAERDERQGR